MAGYEVGPTLSDDVPPWPIGWERDPRVDDGHEHCWESCLLLPGPRRSVGDEVVRCKVCHAPRCGSALGDLDPCMKRRHHDDCHRLLSGAREHLGGLPTLCACPILAGTP